MTTKAQFLNKPKYSKLTSAQKENAWKQHLQSQKNTQKPKRMIRQGQRPKIYNNLNLIAPCTRMYMTALVNPFKNLPELPCIPDTITMPSYKFQCRASGTMSTGSTGVGFCAFCPWQMAANDNAPLGTWGGGSVIYTNVNYNSANFNYVPANGAWPQGVGSVNSDSPYSQAFWNDANARRELRLVAAGIRIKYAGASLKNQGTIYLYRNQGNASLPNGLTAGDLMKNKFTTQLVVSRRSEYIYYSPDLPSLLGYETYVTFFNPAGGVSIGYPYLIYIEGGDQAVPQNWNFEAVAYFESIGSQLTLSRSHADPIGAPLVTAALPLKAPDSPPETVEKEVHSTFLDSLANNVTGATNLLSKVGSTVAPFVSSIL